MRVVVYGSAMIDLYASDNVPMTLVRVERAVPGMPLPSSSRLRFDFSSKYEAHENGSVGPSTRLTYPDVEVKIGDEALARIGEAEQQRIGIQSSAQQKLLDAERPPEGDDFKPATAEQLVLRLYDGDYAAELVRRESNYRVYVVAQLVPGLDELATSNPASVTVTLTLSEDEDAFSIQKRVPLID